MMALRGWEEDGMLKTSWPGQRAKRKPRSFHVIKLKRETRYEGLSDTVQCSKSMRRGTEKRSLSSRLICHPHRDVSSSEEGRRLDYPGFRNKSTRKNGNDD